MTSAADTAPRGCLSSPDAKLAPRATPPLASRMDTQLTLDEHFFAPLKATWELPNVKANRRGCGLVSDEQFVMGGISRVLEVVQSGRDWTQQLRQLHGQEVSTSAYFAQLESPRRLQLVESVAEALQLTQVPDLRAQGDRLSHIRELAGIEVWALDGHSIEHACHDKRVKRSDGSLQYVSISQIYAIDLRTGWVWPMALCKGHEHEMHALKALPPENLKMHATAGTICIYDPAGIDMRWWLQLKAQRGIGFISRTKANMSPMAEIPIPWDRTDPRNKGVIADEILGFDNIGLLRRVTYQNPETGEIFEFLTTEMTLPPGVIALLYGLRWDVEKLFDEFKNKLGETKAWATSARAKTIQSHFIALAHNLLLLLHADLDTQHGMRDVKVGCKFERWVEDRWEEAKQAGRSLNEFVLSARRKGTEHSQQMIRWLRNHRRRGSTLEESLSDVRAYLFVYI